MNPEDLDFEEQERIAEEDRAIQKEEETQNKKCGQFDLLVMQNRIGKFRITDALFEISLGEIMKTIFPRVFITRAEHLYDRREMEYVGYCDLFEPNDFGSRAPEYQFIFHKQPDETILIDVQKC